MKKTLTHGWLLLLLIGCSLAPSYAQSNESKILGTVSDPKGALITNAVVVITEQRTGARYDVKTDENGRYVSPPLPPGTYTIAISVAGFEDVKVSDVNLGARASREVNIEMQVRLGRESVIVSAQKIEEDVQTVPLSVTVFDSEQLAERQIDRLDNLTLHAPNVNFFPTRSSYSNAAIFIRGIGQEDTVFTVDPGVGLYVDDIFLPRAQAALLDVYDVERVEILRGPQGTLYGRNTIGGAIKLITRRPTNDLSAGAEFTTGNYEQLDFKGHVNLPIVRDRVLVRFSGATFNREGFELNTVNGQRLNSRESISGRATLLILPTKDLDLEFRADGVRERPSIHVGALLRPQTTALNFPDLVARRFVTIPASSDPFRVRSNTEDKNDVDTWGVAGTLTWRPSRGLSIKSITSIRSIFSNARIDFDATEARSADVYLIQDHQQASQEVQATYVGESRWRAVGGAFFFYEDDDQIDGTDGSAKGFSIDSTYAQITKSYAAYAQANYWLTKRLSLTGGLRFTHESKIFSRLSEQHVANLSAPDFNVFGGFSQGPGGRPPRVRFPGNGRLTTNIRGVSADWSALTPRFGAEFQWTPEALIYASVARGFKSGGFNGRANEAANPRQREPYNPEYVWTYETGVKKSWFERRLISNLNYFYNQYTDLQLASFITPDNGATFLPQFTNAGRAVTQGFELETSAFPLRGLELFGGVGYTNSEFKEYVERGRDISGERDLPNAPKWTATFGGGYAIPLTATRYIMRVGGDVNYQGKRFLTVSNLPDLLQPGYTVANAYATLIAPHQRWQLTLGARNLTDERYMVAGLDGSPPPFGIVTGFFGDPRTVSLSLRVRLGSQ